MKLPVNYKELSWQKRREVREEYIRIQNGICAYCGEPLSGDPRKDIMNKTIDKRLFPKGMFDYRVHLHHDHDTGMTIGAIHCYCNAVAWQYDGE